MVSRASSPKTGFYLFYLGWVHQCCVLLCWLKHLQSSSIRFEPNSGGWSPISRSTFFRARYHSQYKQCICCNAPGCEIFQDTCYRQAWNIHLHRQHVEYWHNCSWVSSPGNWQDCRLIPHSNCSKGVRPEGIQVLFADERTAIGGPIAGDLNGDAHADLYLQLAPDSEQKSWLQTFVKGRGYVKF